MHVYYRRPIHNLPFQSEALEGRYINQATRIFKVVCGFQPSLKDKASLSNKLNNKLFNV